MLIKNKLNLKAKKVLIALSLAAGVFVLGACATRDQKADVIATLKGKQITSQTIYQEFKNDPTMQNYVRQSIVTNAFTELYGKDVPKADIDKAFEDAKVQMGDNYEAILEQNGLTEADYKKIISDQTIVEYGLRQNLEITDDDLEATWSTYYPEAQLQVAKFYDEDDAKKFYQAAVDGDFVKLAEEHNAIDANVDLTTDSGTTELTDEVKDAVWALDNGEMTQIIESLDSNTYQTQWVVVKMIEKADKGNDIEPYNERLTELTEQRLLQDTQTMDLTIGKVLEKANVQMKDQDLAALLSNYILEAPVAEEEEITIDTDYDEAEGVTVEVEDDESDQDSTTTDEDANSTQESE